jgi:UDP-2,3-diacylglucosamine pyrophosphatase LpxH
MRPDRAIVVISDCHLSAGKVFEGKLNPHEDFVFDDEMAEFIEFHSSGDYGSGVEVELVLAGDYFDFLNVPINGAFDDAVTEEVAVEKAKAMLAGHPKVMNAIREFASQPLKKVTYLIGNHDADLVFEGVREVITRAWDPDGNYPSDKVELIGDRDRISYEEGLEIHHGNQHEVGSEIDFSKPFTQGRRGKKYLRLPWSSAYVLKVVNRLKWERSYLDKVRPIKVFLLFGLVLDPLFTIRFAFLSTFYFIKTRLAASFAKGGIRRNVKHVQTETRVFQTLEAESRQILEASPHLKTVIMGHTHRPMDVRYPDGKQYINTGTWTRMINLDWQSWGQNASRTYALVEFRGQKFDAELRVWNGDQGPSRQFQPG